MLDDLAIKVKLGERVLLEAVIVSSDIGESREISHREGQEISDIMG